MGASDFNSIFQWIISHGYFLMFVAMLLEGPTVTVAAGFACSLHFFNIFLVLPIAMAGDWIPDILYYAIGYYGRTKFVERFGHYIGLNHDFFVKTEQLLNKNPVKALVMIKMTPILPVPGLILVGVSKMPLKKYSKICLLIAIPKSLILIGLGYYLGEGYQTLYKYTPYGGLLLVVFILLLLSAPWAYRKMLSRLAGQIEKNI